MGSDRPQPQQQTTSAAEAKDELAITKDDMAAYLERNPGMAGMMGALLDVIYEKARRQRQDLSDDDFATLFRQILPNAPWREETIVADVLAGIQAFRPLPPADRKPGAPRMSYEDRESQLRAALEKLANSPEVPTRESIAEVLGKDPRTLRRWLSDYPELERLIPAQATPAADRSHTR